MRIQKMTNGMNALLSKGRGMWTAALAFVLTVALPGLAMAEGLDDLGTKAEAEVTKIAGQLAPVGVALILVAAGIAAICVILRLTKKA
ncbi:hypothetical protein C4J81_10330 [Deltaproteobacteria bacterium Smac51]|nr:hypothetical protein C4J81_10330 [Deltaproteobacteria bacterium Smac51]